MSLGIKNKDDPNNDILFLNFNQNSSCIGMGMRQGYQIYNCDPFGCCLSVFNGGISIIQMLFCTSLIALVGSGEQPVDSPRRLRLWNTKTSSIISDFNYNTAVLSVQLNRQRMIVVLEKNIYIYDINNINLIEKLDTRPNPNAICILSPHDNCHLIFPQGSKPGEIVVYDAKNLNVLNSFQVHHGYPAALSINSNGTMLATASEKGTVFRIFEIPSGKRIATFRRGTYPAEIYHVSFNDESTLLCASSSTGTIHIFSIMEDETTNFNTFSSNIYNKLIGSTEHSSNKIKNMFKTKTNDKPGIEESTNSSIANFIPTTVQNINEGKRNIAFVKLKGSNVPNICNISGPKPGETVANLIVATLNGFFYKYSINLLTGGECRLIKENILKQTASEEIEASFLT